MPKRKSTLETTAPLPSIFLAIDIGNTHVDLGLFSAEQSQTAGIQRQLIRHEKRPTRPAEQNDLHQLLGPATAPLTGVAIGSVVAKLADTYAELCRRLCQGPVLQFAGSSDWGLRIDYDDPNRVGVDRLAAAAAAHRLTPTGQATIIIDAGTALTIDAVNAEGTFLGGAIAPGLQLGLQALSSGTSLLPRIELDTTTPLLGKTTVAGLRSGALHGSAALIEGICARIIAELDCPATVFLTGGDGPLLHPLIAGIDICDTALVLRGLELVYSRHTS